MSGNQLTSSEIRRLGSPDRTPVIIAGQEVIKVLSYTPSGSSVMPAGMVGIPLSGMNRVKAWFSAVGGNIPAGATVTFKFYRDDILPDGKTKRVSVGNPAGYVIPVPAVTAGNTVGLTVPAATGILSGATEVEAVLSAAVTVTGGGTGHISIGLTYANAEQSYMYENTVLSNIPTNTTGYIYFDMDDVKYLGIQCGITQVTDSITLTLEATCQNDGTAPAACVYQDITEELTGSASFLNTSEFFIIDTPLPVKYLRLKYSTSNAGGGDCDLAVYAKKMY